MSSSIRGFLFLGNMKKLIGKILLIEEISVGKDDCLIIRSPNIYEELSIDSMEHLIKLLSNSIKYHNVLNNYSQQKNQEYFDSKAHCFENRSKPIPKRKGFIYVALCKRTGLYKIGSTSKQSPQMRINQLKVANVNISLFLSFETKDLSDEKVLHKMFETKRIGGEWFELHSLDIEKIKEFYNK